MRHVAAILGRELAAYFLGPMAYVMLVVFQLIAALNFWELLEALSQTQLEFSSIRDPMNTYLSASTPFWFSMLVAVPLLTMRLIAEERKTGTIETLLTLPITEVEIVVAKWLAAVVMYLVLLLPFLIYLPVLRVQARFEFDLGPLVSLLAGLLSLGMMFTAIGLLFSALTRNQIVAAIWTFVVLFMIVVLTPLVYFYAARQQADWAEGARHLAVLYQVQALGLGQLDLRVIVMHLSISAVALYAAVKVLEAKRQR